MNLICYLIDDHPVDIRPARNDRNWMNQTPDAYAYRCLPLSIANGHGWEICCPVTCEAEWNGGTNKDDIQITFKEGGDSFLGTKKISTFVESHFGSGILTFNVGVVIRTDPGYDLWVTGPVNDFKDGVQALTAVIETYWMPFIFTMNWKFTRARLKVRFEKGEPFCFFFPVEHGLLERVNPTFKQIGEDPALEKNYNFAFNKRAFLPLLQILKGDELKDEEKHLKFQGWYMRGEMPDNTKIEDHKKRVRTKPFQIAADKPRTNK
jgi:Family of unknown function (DUF6065)